MNEFAALLQEVRACNICASVLSLGPRPVLQAHPDARILIAGQAPGRKVHASGVPFDDASGERLRDWLGLACEQFYDPHTVAILPMGFCYPGSGRSGDLPPRPECAPAWRAKLLSHLSNVRLTVVIGQYAQAFHLDDRPASVTAAVQSWHSYWPRAMPLPHPSLRNNLWLRRNPWFESELLPVLRAGVKQLLSAGG